MAWVLAILVGLWWLCKWFFKWILAPFFIGITVGGAFWKLSLIPFVGVLIHFVVIALAFITIDGVALPLIGSNYVVFIVILFLAFVDCVNDLIIAAKFKRMKDSIIENKLATLGCVLMVAVAVFYYSAPGDGSRLANIAAHYATLLFLAVAPRAIFAIGEIYAMVLVYPKVKKEIRTGVFFKTSIDPYRERYVETQLSKGLIISNSATIEWEKKASLEKLDKMYPKKTLEKAAEKLSQIFTDAGKQVVKERDDAKNELEDIGNRVSYISLKGFEEFCANAEKALLECGMISPRPLMEKKLSALYKTDDRQKLGIDFFVIQGLAKGVSEGRIIDKDISDRPLDNHVYRHTRSNVQPKITNANENPLLALDDD
jgi:hypothetical protein